MTTKQLEDKLSVLSSGSGSYLVIIDYNRKEYRCKSNDSLSFDRITEHHYDNSTDRHIYGGMTYRQALQNFWYECVRKNNLNETYNAIYK